MSEAPTIRRTHRAAPTKRPLDSPFQAPVLAGFREASAVGRPTRPGLSANRRHDQAALLVDLEVDGIAGFHADLVKERLRNDDAVRISHLADVTFHASTGLSYNYVI